MAKINELVRFKHIESLGDCTETYYCELLTTFSVQEFVQAVLQNKNEWGYVKVGDNILSARKLEYRHGEIVSDEHGVSSIKDTVKRIYCNGGWSFMEYLVQI